MCRYIIGYIRKFSLCINIKHWYPNMTPQLTKVLDRSWACLSVGLAKKFVRFSHKLAVVALSCLLSKTILLDSIATAVISVCI